MLVDTEQIDDSDADRRHDHHARYARRHDEGEKETDDDKAQQQTGIAQPDAVDDKSRNAERQTGFGRHGAEKHGADIKP